MTPFGSGVYAIGTTCASIEQWPPLVYILLYCIMHYTYSAVWRSNAYDPRWHFYQSTKHRGNRVHTQRCYGRTYRTNNAMCYVCKRLATVCVKAENVSNMMQLSEKSHILCQTTAYYLHSSYFFYISCIFMLLRILEFFTLPSLPICWVNCRHNFYAFVIKQVHWWLLL